MNRDVLAATKSNICLCCISKMDHFLGWELGYQLDRITQRLKLIEAAQYCGCTIWNMRTRAGSGMGRDDIGLVCQFLNASALEKHL